MECAFLATVILFVGAIFTFLTKVEYKHKIFGISGLVAAGTALYPLLTSINYGTVMEFKFKFQILLQKLTLNLDPFSAFIVLILILPFLIYVCNLLIKKNNPNEFHILEILMLVMGVVLFTLFVQNGIYFYLGIALICLLMLVCTGILNEQAQSVRNKSLLIYVCSAFIFLALMVLGVFCNIRTIFSII